MSQKVILYFRRDRINQQLAPDFLRIDVQGPIHGNMLTVLLYSLGIQPPQEIDRTTRMWIPNHCVARFKR